MNDDDVSYCANCVLYKVEVERLREQHERDLIQVREAHEARRLAEAARDLISAYMAGDDLAAMVARLEEVTGGQQHGA